MRRFGQIPGRNVAGSPTGHRPRLTASIALALGLSMVARLAAAADSPPANANAPAAGSEPTVSLQEVVVTATRHEESLSKVPISATAITQEGMDLRGIKDISDVARFTPGINVDNSGTSNISIRGISSSGGAGTTGIYIDDTPIQIRALAFNPDETLPKSFDIDRVEVLRGPQGTLFGAGSEGGTVRYITEQPSLTKTSIYSRDELSFTQGGDPSYEVGIAAGGPLIDGTLGARVTVWYRKDGGWINRVDPTDPGVVDDKNANWGQTMLVRLASVWKPSDRWTVTGSIYYQDHYVNDASNYWPLYSNPGSNSFVSANPTQRFTPDTFYLPAIKIDGDFGAVRLISNTSYYHRAEITGYDGTLYNLGFYQAQPQMNASTLATCPVTNPSCVSPVLYLNSPNAPYTFPGGQPFPLLDGTGVHLPAGLTNYRSPASINNDQQNITQEIRLQSNDNDSKLTWTTGVFFSLNKQWYLEQINDPMLNQLTQALEGTNVAGVFGVGYDPQFPTDSYFLHTDAKDTQLALYGEGTYNFNDHIKMTAGARVAQSSFNFNTFTGGPQLFGPNQSDSPSKSEHAFTPKLGVSDQIDPFNMVYANYARGYRPGGGNNPVPYAACQADFQNFGISNAPLTYNSDTVDSFEVGAKDNFGGRLRLASSLYLIKWNNIQQTVVPPICQISFIANLGKATAKGGDIQAEWAITEGFSADLSMGYTEARYTQDSRLSPAETSPVVASGDAIVGESGQPNSPFTASLGLEYKFQIGEHSSLVRFDYQYEAKNKWLPAGQDPNSLQYDPANYTLPATNFITARASMDFGAWTGALFCENLANAHTITNYNWTIDSSVPGTSRLQRDYTFQPRTIGVTFTYRK